MGFEVGKEVVAIKDHHQGPFKKGDTFMLNAIRKGCCSYCSLQLDVGIIDESYDDYTQCDSCGNILNEKKWWFNSKYFVHLDDISISELIEVLQEELFK